MRIKATTIGNKVAYRIIYIEYKAKPEASTQTATTRTGGRSGPAIGPPGTTIKPKIPKVQIGPPGLTISPKKPTNSRETGGAATTKGGPSTTPGKKGSNGQREEREADPVSETGDAGSTSPSEEEASEGSEADTASETSNDQTETAANS